MKTFAKALLLSACGACLADEPGWTSEQRTEQRQVVVDATVTQVEKVRDQPTPNVELMKAMLEVSGVRKGGDILGGSNTIEIYYESSPLGAGYRCPTFPVLSLKQRGRFYLSSDEALSGKKAFVLGMGRDVEPIRLESATVLPKLMEALRKNPSFEDLAAILGEPWMDIGSGIHIFVYLFDQGPSLAVGTKDKRTILYVDRADNRLYPTPAEPTGGVQPTTQPESISEGSRKPQSEAEEDSR